ncbi:MAG TPA: hypothetical protein PK299_03385 [Anaerolineales bacterium]|nr:hypothetical protein [Anaerolineales bacterium]
MSDSEVGQGYDGDEIDYSSNSPIPDEFLDEYDFPVNEVPNAFRRARPSRWRRFWRRNRFVILVLTLLVLAGCVLLSTALYYQRQQANYAVSATIHAIHTQTAQALPVVNQPSGIVGTVQTCDGQVRNFPAGQPICLHVTLSNPLPEPFSLDELALRITDSKGAVSRIGVLQSVKLAANASQIEGVNNPVVVDLRLQNAGQYQVAVAGCSADVCAQPFANWQVFSSALIIIVE